MFLLFSDADFSPYRFEKVQGGSVTVLDPATLQLKDEWRTRIDPFDLAVDKKGHVFVTSGSGQHTMIINYDRATKQELSFAWIEDADYVELHPFEDKLYSVSTAVSPRDISCYTVSPDGKFIDSKDSLYHGEYEFSDALGVTPNGRYVVNGSGNVFTSSSNPTLNMKYIAAIDKFEAVASDPENPQYFYTGLNNVINQITAIRWKKRR
ncbi:hypothetical protein SD71_15065 [Cohnella kolymensis]|uniref:SMP-30/Gluconolactonase/LRE-like region domain-containing protein n=1 Tax=Cohnella kolymensis TaxID=1590652 RepID=A0ABR5A1Y6_9BACL|nr:hypothetical protein [Cohnella kolymensis]KIL35000.1 hypothetical protein SD71_15065 [Cohnella kolymensis]